MNAKTATNWILTKVSDYLEVHEGCTVLEVGSQVESAKIVLHDSFGFKYEIEVKLLGRINFDAVDQAESVALRIMSDFARNTQ